MRHQKNLIAQPERQRGAAAIGAAIFVAGAVTTGVFVMNQSAQNAEVAQEILEDKNAAIDSSFGALRRFSQVLQSGDIAVSAVPGSVGEFTAANGVLATIPQGGSGWIRHPSKQNVILLRTCSDSQLAEGENFDLPAGASASAQCSASRMMVTTVRTIDVFDAGPTAGGLWAKMHVNTGMNLTGDETDNSGMSFAIDIPDSDGGSNSGIGDACPYKDPALNPVGGPKYTQDFYLGAGGRYYAGWVKLGYQHSYPTDNVTAGSAWVGISNWQAIPETNSGHGWEWVQRSTATETIENWEFAVARGAGTWSHQAQLRIPKVSAGGDPAQCYWWVTSRRAPTFGAGCFASGTQITMADGSRKAVETVTGGDLVRNPVTGGTSKVSRVSAGPEDLPMIRVTIGGKQVDVTKEHPFMSKDGLVRGDALKVGLEVMTAGGAMQKIDRLETLATLDVRPMVYNLAVEGSTDDYVEHMIEANGITTGDLHLQEVLTHGKGVAIAVPPPIEDVKKAISRLFGVDPDQASGLRLSKQ